VELPVLASVAPPPLAVGVVALVLEAHGDPVVREAPELLAQPVVELARPLALEELHDRLATAEELVAVAPLRVLRVGERDALRIARVPGVLGGLHLLARRLLCERRNDLRRPALLRAHSTGPASTIIGVPPRSSQRERTVTVFCGPE